MIYIISCVCVCSRLKLLKVEVVLAILDCCREFHEHELVDSTRGGGNQHLAVGSESFRSTIVAYSCGPNGYAIDGKGKHGTSIGAPQIHTAHTGIPIFCVLVTTRSGLYTQCLERCIVIPGLETRKMFRRVGQVVLEMSDGRQHPVRTCGSSPLDLLQLMSVSPPR